MLTQQIMMAETFGWDPLFLASLPFQPKNGSVPVSYRREQLDPEIITKGNISLDILLNGTPQQVREKVRYVKESTRGYRHIIGLSDNILDHTPCENLKAFVDESRRTD